ncbi:MAG TPA: H-X9-DG-CTERM domain-containing protein [Candidatus Bathyarchaeia archaeon]|nr:H-X9-DG-CTERM domain-containing protein [Candidatus Bathyarchaeia archaeon]
MDGQNIQCADVRAGLRDYVLERRADLEAHFAACPACREALEAERATIARLDMLPQVEPPEGLAKETLRRIAETQREAEREAEERRRKRVPRLVSAVASVCLVAVCVAILLPALARSRESARRSSSANNLKQMGLVFKMYANESPGSQFPPMAPYPDLCVFDLRTVYPEFLSDPSVLVSPKLPKAEQLVAKLREAFAKTPPDWDLAHRIVAQSYVYTGYAIKEDSELGTFREARVRLHDKDLEVTGRALFRLREGVERFWITDINNPAADAVGQSGIPVLMENPSTRKDGINVLYMDGHVEFVPNGEKFPATKAFREAFPLPPLKK